MVKKLIKHEFAYYFRTLGPFLPILLVVGLVAKIFQLIDNDTIYTLLPLISSFAVLYIGTFALTILTTVIGIVRFYKNLYTAEGYLTMTLPVTHHQHILVKLLAYLCFSALSILTVALSVSIAFFGEPLLQVLYEIGYVFVDLFKTVPTVHAVFYVIEILILTLISVCSMPLLYYACITIGQTAKKNRILLAIGAYFGHYMIVQVLSVVCTLLFLVLVEVGAFNWLGGLFGKYPFAMIHVLLCIAIVITAAITGVYYFVTHRVMSKKLNLE